MKEGKQVESRLQLHLGHFDETYFCDLSIGKGSAHQELSNGGTLDEKGQRMSNQQKVNSLITFTIRLSRANFRRGVGYAQQMPGAFLTHAEKYRGCCTLIMRL